MSSDGLLSLRWNNHRTSFMQAIATLRNDKENYSDITLACDGKFYSVHKFVLSTCSDYFVEIFNSTTCKHPVIILKDVRQEDLEALLNYMYLGEVSVAQNDLASLIKAAECLKIKGLAVPDESPYDEDEPSQPETVTFNEPKLKKRRLEGDVSVRNQSSLQNKQNIYSKTSEPNVTGSTQDGEEFRTAPQENQKSKKNCNENIRHDKDRVPSIENMVIKEEAPIKYENEDDFSLTDASSLDSCVLQTADFQCSKESEERIGTRNVGLPQQYPLQPQTFEDVVSQALPGPSLQEGGCQNWDGVQSKRESVPFNLQSYPDQNLPHHQHTLPAGPIEESFAIMRGSVGSEGDITQDPCTANRFIGDRQMMNDPRLDMDTSRHAREWRCMYPDCSYVTDRESWLKQHFRRHTGEKPFSCPFCSYRSAQKGNLNVHIKRTHFIENVSIPDDPSQSDSEMLPIT